MNALSWLVYIPLQIVMMPAAVVGILMVAYRQLLVSRRLRVSQTAIEIFNGRWTMHIFGMRDDPGAAALGPALPNTSTVGLWLALFPLWVKARIAGVPSPYPRHVEPGHETVAELVTGRTVYFDQVITQQLPQVSQLVMMGAGMDTRPYGVLELGDVRVFEADQSTIQLLKREFLEQVGIPTDHVTFVPIDFATDDLFSKLRSAGYDPGKKTLFLWEGVTLYLSEKSVRETMATIRDNAAPGSILLVDLYGERILAMARSRGVKKTLELTGEDLAFGLDLRRDWEAELSNFVQSTQYQQGETFFLGSETPKGPFGVVVELRL